MIKVLVKNNTTREEVITDLQATPLQIFNQKGIDISGSQVNFNGVIITSEKFNSTFEELGVEDGSVVNLNSVVKADGGNN